MTVFIHIAPGEGTEGPGTPNWRPWINSTNRSEAEQLAAHRYLRDRGGVGERESPFRFTLWSYTDQTECWPNGRPKHVNAITFSARAA